MARVFLVAVALAGIALALKSVLVTRGLTDPTYLLFFPAVAASAWYGGVWPGVLTTLLCGVGEAVVFQAPIGSPGLVDTADQIRMALFAVAGGTVSLLTGLLRAARTGAERTREQLRLTVAAQEQARVEAEHVAARLDVVSGVASALASAVTADDVGNAVLTAASRTVGTHAGAVAVTSDAGDALLTISTLGYPPEVLASTRRIPLDAPVPIADAARSRQPLWFESERAVRDAYPAIASYPDDRYDGSMAVLPLTADDRLVGAMWLRFPEPRTFTADDRSFIVALAQQCAQALDRARLFEAERRTRTDAEAAERRLALLADASAVLGASPAIERNLEEVARLVAESLGAIASVDIVRETGVVELAALAHPDAEIEAATRARRAERPVDLGLPSPLATVLRTGEPVLVPDISAIKPPDEAHAQVLAELRELRIHSLVTVPLLASGTPFGTLSVASTDPAQPLGERQLTFMEDLARRIASAVETSRLYRELDQFKGTVDASLDAIFMFDPRTLRFLYVNDGAVAQLGYPRDQLLGMRALDIEPNFDEDGYRDLIGSLSGGSQASHTFTTVHRRLDGREIPVEVFLQAVRLPGGEAVMVANARDISERIEAQARLYRLARAERSRAAELNAVLQAMGEAILVCDGHGQVLLANQAAERLFDRLPADHDELGRRLGGATLPALGVEAGPVEMYVATGQQQRWIELTTYPVILEAAGNQRRGGVASSVATILVMRDVTEVREAQALREAFLGVLSHELRTPITTIYGTTKVLNRRTSTLDAETRDELIADIGAEADRLYRIVEDLVVLSRAETGIELEGEPLLLRHLLPSVVGSERQRWPATRFEIEVPERLPTARGDATYVEQVLRNLLGNAAKYGPTPGTVTVSADATDDELIVCVLDRGIGVDPDEAPRLFELFYRSAATATRARGAGIGLWVCRRLVEGMGGRIWAKPREGGGAEFGFSLRLFTETDLG